MRSLDNIITQRLTKAAWRRREAQWARFHRWEAQQLRAAQPAPRKAFRWFDDLLSQATTRSAWRAGNGLAGLEAVLRIAVIVNHPRQHA